MVNKAIDDAVMDCRAQLKLSQVKEVLPLALFAVPAPRLAPSGSGFLVLLMVCVPDDRVSRMVAAG